MLGTFNENGFRVVAANAVDLIAGTQAASSGFVAANVRHAEQVLHADLGRVSSTLLTQSNQLNALVEGGTEKIRAALAHGFGTLEVLSGLSVAVQAVGFAAVAHRLGQVNGSVEALHIDMRRQGEALLEAQRTTDRRMEGLVDLATRSLKTQEQIVEALVRSRTVEAAQLVRQGLDHLRFGHDEDALDRFKRSLEFDSTTFLAHSQLGELFAKKNFNAEAETHFGRAIQFSNGVDPDFIDQVRRRYGAFLESVNKLPDAISVWRTLKETTSAPEDAFHLAELLAVTGASDEAIQLLREAVVNSPPLFAAAMASEQLAALGPPRTAVLVEVDRKKREDLLSLIDSACTSIERLERIHGLVVSDGDPGLLAIGERAMNLVDDLKRRGTHLLEQALIRPFHEMEALSTSVNEYQKQAGELKATLINEIRHVVGLSESSKIRQIKENLNELANSCVEPIKEDETEMVAGSLGVLLGLSFLGLTGASLMGWDVGGYPSIVNIVVFGITGGPLLFGGWTTVRSCIQGNRRYASALSSYKRKLHERSKQADELRLASAKAISHCKERFHWWASETGDQSFTADLQQLLMGETLALVSPEREIPSGARVK